MTDLQPGVGSRTIDASVDSYCATRALTDALTGPLSAEDQTAQSMPDVSPTKWHRAHVTWFFETFVLEQFAPVFTPVDAAYRMMFNSYYEAVGPQYPRSARGVITRPGAAEVGEYRRRIDAQMADLLREPVADDPRLAALVVLGQHHEQQHQELILMDIQHLLSLNPLEPVYRGSITRPSSGDTTLGWVDVDGGLIEVGHCGGGFAFDNEGPRHTTYVAPFRIADRLVTCGEWRSFIDDGGYRRPELWLSDGWHTVAAQGWSAPLYWRSAGSAWVEHTLAGTHPVIDDEPVRHISHYEADAYARWAEARLPTEHEWELAAAHAEPGRPFDLDGLVPQPARPSSGALRQMFGDCWQWSASAYLPYPGFAPAAGAVGEYNGKFMSGQMVLRGSSSFTPPGHARTTYRNFFPPHCRWMPAGLRLAGAPS